MTFSKGKNTEGRQVLRIVLLTICGGCFFAFGSDGQFPIAWGLALLAVTWCGWETYFMLSGHPVSLLLLHILFLLTYPIYIAHLVIDPFATLLLVPFDNVGYTALLMLSIAGYLGTICAQLGYAVTVDRSGSRYFSSVARKISKSRIGPILVASLLFYAISLGVIYKTGIGVVGYNARPETRFLYGFTARLSHLVVPLMNLFTLELLLARRSRRLTAFMVLMLAEALGLTFVSLSRFALLSYIGLPALLMVITPFRSHIKSGQLIRVAAIMSTVMVFGILVADGARVLVYRSLRGGVGYERSLEVDPASFKVGLSLGTFFFFERLSGARELSWVDEAIRNPQPSDIWYSLVMGPPASDPAYINRSVLGMTEEVNEDTGFGSGLTLLANFRFGGRIMTVFVGMLGITVFFLWFETITSRLVGARSLVLFIVATVVINLWQGMALYSVFQRPFQMCFIGVSILFALSLVFPLHELGATSEQRLVKTQNRRSEDVREGTSPLAS